MVLIQYIILAFLQHNKDNNTTVNRSQLNNRSQYNFYWLFRNSMGIHYIYKPFSVVMFKIKKNALLVDSNCCSSVITAIVGRGRIKDDQNSQEISVHGFYDTVDC